MCLKKKSFFAWSFVGLVISSQDLQICLAILEDYWNNTLCQYLLIIYSHYVKYYIFWLFQQVTKKLFQLLWIQKLFQKTSTTTFPMTCSHFAIVADFILFPLFLHLLKNISEIIMTIAKLSQQLLAHIFLLLTNSIKDIAS